MANTPLAFLLRPKTLDEVIGQKHLVGPNGALRNSIEKGIPFSMILFGPPGSGKTSIAMAYAREMGIHYSVLNAVTTDKKEMAEAISEARLYGSSFIIMDEVHRLDKTKQDLLLPYVEEGSFFLIGATTANPYVSLSRAIRSRARIFEIKPLDQNEVLQGLYMALDKEEGYKGKLDISEEALGYIARMSGGDLRHAYNMLEQAYISYKGKRIELSDMQAIERVPNIVMDKDEEEHYDSVSALQKSIRGQDVDAALYYLARLCVAEDLDSIKRRLLVTAYEDIGLANPQAVLRTQMAIEAAEKVGFPEAIIPLGDAVIDLCLSPHSKSGCVSIQKAMAYVKEHPTRVRDYLRLTPVSLKEEDKYPYDRSDLWAKMAYLPEGMEQMRFFLPNEGTLSSYEKALLNEYKKLTSYKRRGDLSKLKKEV